MSERLQVLIVDDEPIVCKRLKPAIEKMGCSVETFLEPRAALARIAEKAFDVVVTDVRMDDIDGIQVLQQAKQRCERTEVIIITGFAMIALAREAMDKGAFDFISKPFKPDDLREAILRAADKVGVKLDYQLASARGQG